MNCIKCGVEIKEPQVFCDKCLAEMEKYPVEPNVSVNLPPRPARAPAKKKARRTKYVNPEEQIRHLRTRVRLLWLTVVLLFAAFALVAVMMLNLLGEGSVDFQPGQNYNTMNTGSET